MKKIMPVLLLGLLALCWVITVQNFGKNQNKYQTHMEKAREYEEKQIYIDALAEYEEAVLAAKEPYEAELKIFDTYLALGKKNDYAKYGEKLLETYDYPEEVVQKLVAYHLDRKHEEKAVLLLKEAIEKYPEKVSYQEILLSLQGAYKDFFVGAEEVKPFLGNYAAVKEKGKWGLIDSDGNHKIESVYRDILPYDTEGMYAAVADESWYYVDEDGYRKLVPDIEADTIGVFGDGLATYSVGGKYGFMNTEMQTVQEPEWDDAGTFANKRAPVRSGDQWGLVDEKFQPVTGFIYEDIVRDPYGMATRFDVYLAKKDGVYRLYDMEGNQLGSLSFDEAKAFASKEPAAVRIGNLWGHVDITGQLVTEAKYQDADSFSCRLAPVMVDGNWGYISLDGVMRIEPHLKEAGVFSDAGSALVYDKYWKLIKLIQ